MARISGPGTPASRPTAHRLATVTLGLLLLAGVTAAAASYSPSSSHASASGVRAADGSVTLDVTATSSLSFVPDMLTVAPGQLVHLVVTQDANFNHTFTLSPVANFQFASSSSPGDLYTFFHTHTAIVNLSLGMNPGAKTFANFTAPAAGSYEFLCLIPTHFQSGMHGTLVSQNGSSSGSSPVISTTALIGIVVVVVVVAAVAGVLLARRRKPVAPTGSTLPPTS